MATEQTGAVITQQYRITLLLTLNKEQSGLGDIRDWDWTALLDLGAGESVEVESGGTL